MEIMVGAVTRHGPRQAIHIRTGTALQGQLHAAVRRQADLAGHYRVEGDGRVAFDSHSAAVAACGRLEDRHRKDMAVLKSPSGRYYVEPLVEQLAQRSRDLQDLHVSAEVVRAHGLQGVSLSGLLIAANQEAVAVRA
jgi:hypothetical protein